MSTLFFWFFLILMATGMPVVFAMLIAPSFALLIEGQGTFLDLVVQRMVSGMNSFPLLAVPFFILAGEAMNQGGITVRLIDFAKSLIGHVRGGLIQVNILSSIMFSGLSGSAVADTSALGSMLIPSMEKNGYHRRFAAAVTAASSVIGPIIPPSGIMILYAFIMEVSVGGLFAAGLVPGILIGGGLMTVSWYLSKRRNYPVAERKATWKERGSAARYAILPLLTPVILLGGILSGIFTPTEAAAVAAGYGLLVSVVILRTLRVSELGRVFAQVAMSSAVILLLVGAAVSFSAIVSLSGAATELTEFAVGLTENKYLLLFIINLILLIVGMVLDAGPAILILGPVLEPVATSIGVEPLHFAIVMCVNVTVGLATPPMGLVLFVAASISRQRAERIALEMLPFLAVEIGVIFLITFFPALPMTLPRLFGFA